MSLHSLSPARSTRPAEPRIEVTAVESRAEMRRFIEFPYELYRDDPHFVAPLRQDQREILDVEKHPFYQHAEMQCYLARSNGRICGRIAAILDDCYKTSLNEKIGTFGFYESVDSQAVAGALFQNVRAWLGARGAALMRGPMNPSITYECGVLVDGFDSAPSVMTTYNPPYYARLFEGAGLEKARDLYAYRLACGEHYVAKMEKLSQAGRIHSVAGTRIRTVRMDRFDHEIEAFWQIHHSAWSENWGVAPITLDEMRYLGRQIRPIMVPKLALIAEVAGQPVAFGLAVPDINQALRHANGSLFPFGLIRILYYKSRIKKLRVLALGVVEGYRDSAIAAQLYVTLIRNGLDLGYTEAECSWVLEDNRPMNRSLKFMGAVRQKTYRIYEARLTK